MTTETRLAFAAADVAKRGDVFWFLLVTPERVVRAWLSDSCGVAATLAFLEALDEDGDLPMSLIVDRAVAWGRREVRDWLNAHGVALCIRTTHHPAWIERQVLGFIRERGKEG